MILTHSIHQLVEAAQSGGAQIEKLWIALSKLEGTQKDITKARRAFTVLMDKLMHISNFSNEKIKCHTINKILTDEIQYISADRNPLVCLYHHVLLEGKANCLSLCALTYIIGLKFGLKLHVNLCPGHSYMTMTTYNCEFDFEPASNSGFRPKFTLRNRISLSDKYSLSCPSFFRPLQDKELFACILTRYMSVLLSKHQLKSAYYISKLTTNLFPSNPDTHFNKGITAALLGYRRVASKAFDEVRNLYPPLLRKIPNFKQ